MLPLDQKKLALLQGRLGLPMPNENAKVKFEYHTNVSLSFQNFQSNPTPEVIEVVDDMNELSHKSGSRGAWNHKETSCEASSNSKHRGDIGDDDQKETTPKRQKLEVIEPSPESMIIANAMSQ
jgi:hypothetical protein